MKLHVLTWSAAANGDSCGARAIGPGGPPQLTRRARGRDGERPHPLRLADSQPPGSARGLLRCQAPRDGKERQRRVGTLAFQDCNPRITAGPKSEHFLAESGPEDACPRGDDTMRTRRLAFAIPGKTAEAGAFPSAPHSRLGPPPDDAMTGVRADARTRSSDSSCLCYL
jgi:hypothetical protein